MTLRTQLTVAVVVVLLVATSLVAVVAVRGFTASAIEQIDQQLLAIADRPMGGPGAPPPVPPTDSDDAEVEYRLVAEARYDAAGNLVSAMPAGFSDDPEPPPALPAALGADVEPLEPVTVPAVDGSLDYRAIAIAQDDGSTSVVAISLASVQATTDDLIRLVLLAGGLILFAAALASWLLIRRSLRPVDEMIDTAEAIGAGDLSRRIDHSEDDTELGRLATALDDMLAQLEGAFAERRTSEEQLRRFAADASHELRTPIAAISGYAELYGQGGIPPGEPLDRAMGRIASESGRMGRLVEDLLLLARLDQEQPLEWSEVDLADLVRDAAADLRAVDPERPVTVDAVGRVLVRGDERRLRQVVANLVGNARTHTPAGTPIHLAARPVSGDEAELVVTDQGPGIEPQIRDRVFDRFYRGDKSRKVGTGGSGLGLSIVASVVAAHGGRVGVADSDAGAVIEVRLPVVAPDRSAAGAGDER